MNKEVTTQEEEETEKTEEVKQPAQTLEKEENILDELKK